MNILRKFTLCLIGACPFAPNSDDTGCWGECICCGKRAGFVDRATLRSFLDREYDAGRAAIGKEEGTND
jgi:hypothetical protein